MAQSAAATGSLARQSVVSRGTVRATRRRNHHREIIERRRVQWWHFVAPVFLFCTLLFQLSIRVSLIEHSYSLESLRERALKSDGRLRELRLEHALVTRPGMLRDEAVKRLRMAPLMPQRIRKVG